MIINKLDFFVKLIKIDTLNKNKVLVPDDLFMSVFYHTLTYHY